MSEHVRIERDGAVLALTLARPEQRNAITAAMYAALAESIGEAGRDPTIRLITLSGEGANFSAGNDLSDFLVERPGDAGSADLPVWRFLRALAANEVPILATVQGNAIGIGTTLLFHCDLVIAEEGCRFLMPFVDLGLVPEAASSLILPELAGRRVAARYLLLGEPFGASEALAIGLASHVAATGEGAAMRERLVTALMSKPADAMRETQKLLRMSDRASVLRRMDMENRQFAERLQSDEVKQAIGSFFAARAAQDAG